MLTFAAIQIGYSIGIISLILLGLSLSVFLGWIFTENKEDEK